MSVIHIRNLVIEAKHGVHDWEKRRKQKFQVSVEVSFDASRPSVSDQFSDTLDWSRLRDTIVRAVEKNSFNLIERLAHEIATQLLADSRVKGVVVSIDKLEAFNSGVPGFTAEYLPQD